jgi:hypothetical protein
MASWNESHFDRLFAAHPPTLPTAPSRAQAAALGRQMGFSEGAVLAHWNDARSVILGQKNASSQGLRAYLVRRGWLAPAAV